MALRLHSRLVALNVVALSITGLLLGYFLSNNVRKAFESEIEDQLYKTATLARIYLREQPAGADPQDLVTAISRLLAVRVTLIAADGRVLGDSDITRGGLSALENHRRRPEFLEAQATGRGATIRQSTTLGISFIYVATTMNDGSVLRVAMPLSAVETLISGLRQQLILAIVVGVCLSAILGYMVYAVVSRPLARVAEASQQLAVGNLDAQIPVAGDRDLSTVGSSLNAMAKNLRLKMSELEGDKHRTEAIIAAMSSGVIVFNRQARIVLANQSIQTLLDLQGESAGRRPMEIVRDPVLEHVVLGALNGAEAADIEFVTSRGKTLLAHAAPVRALNGDIELAVVVFHDLTEIRRTERMRKDFVANVSHEFKTPLTSIMGYAETLLSMEGETPEIRREFLTAIERNGRLLQGLVEDLLVLASLEGEVPVEKKRCNLKELIEEQIQSKQHLFSSRGLQVKLECVALDVVVDWPRLRRALSNLLDNAAHYNRPGGEVRISTSSTTSHFRIDITDTGEGISQAEQVRVFERFYRIDKSRARDSGGTGLGLSIARHAIESQGGTLTVSSKLGVGTTFTIILPVS